MSDIPLMHTKSKRLPFWRNWLNGYRIFRQSGASRKASVARGLRLAETIDKVLDRPVLPEIPQPPKEQVRALNERADHLEEQARYLRKQARAISRSEKELATP